MCFRWQRVRAQAGALARLELARFVASRAARAIANEYLADLGSVAGFIYALALAATDRGLASCIQYSWALVAPELRAELGLAANREVVGAVVLGRPGGAGALAARVTPRKPVAVTWHASP